MFEQQNEKSETFVRNIALTGVFKIIHWVRERLIEGPVRRLVTIAGRP